MITCSTFYLGTPLRVPSRHCRAVWQAEMREHWSINSNQLVKLEISVIPETVFSSSVIKYATVIEELAEVHEGGRINEQEDAGKLRLPGHELSYGRIALTMYSWKFTPFALREHREEHKSTKNWKRKAKTNNKRYWIHPLSLIWISREKIVSVSTTRYNLERLLLKSRAVLTSCVHDNQLQVISCS